MMNNQSQKTKNSKETALRIFFAICTLVIIGLMINVVCKDRKSDLTLYEVVAGDDILLEANSFGRYTLEPDKVYAIYWDVPFIYSEGEGDKMNAEIDIRSDYLIEDGKKSVITIDIEDNYRGGTIYSEELGFVSASGNLGIEFCAEECRMHPDGWRPTIRDNQFVVYFYTSGEYVAYEHNGITGPDGRYGYTYRTEGSKSDEDFVNRPEREFTGYYLPQQLNLEDPPTPPVATEPVDDNLSKGIDESDDNNQSDNEESDSEISDEGGQSGPELSAGQEFLESPEAYEVPQKTESPDTPSEATKRTD